MRQTYFLTKNLQKALGDPDLALLHAHLVRLVVLYEDLRIELTGAEQESIASMDVTAPSLRRHYFMRRAIGTIVEFAEGIRLLNELEAFQVIRSRLTPENAQAWDDGVAYFREHEPLLERVRNDIGGHFGYGAALYAVRNFAPFAMGYFRYRLDHGQETGAAWYLFAEEVAATALSRHREKGERIDDFIHRLFTILDTAFRHAVRATSILGASYLAPRFR